MHTGLKTVGWISKVEENKGNYKVESYKQHNWNSISHISIWSTQVVGHKCQVPKYKVMEDQSLYSMHI